jgi:rod shape-determining protein MreC
MAPFRALAQRFAYLLLVLGAFALMVLGKADIVLIDRVKTSVSDAVEPVLGFFSEPASRVAGAMQEVRTLSDLRAENARLANENERLRHWQEVARRLEVENQGLRQLSHLIIEPQPSFVTARVIADAGGAFVRSVLINAGNRAGLGKGNAVMTGDGLIGRVSELGERSARVLLITDLNSRIPVVLERSRERALMAGDNSGRPRLLYLGTSVQPPAGERVLTSGDGGIFPAGLPVGAIAETHDGSVRVQPLVDFTRLDFVRVIDFKLDGPAVTTEVPRGRERR